MPAIVPPTAPPIVAALAEAAEPEVTTTGVGVEVAGAVLTAVIAALVSVDVVAEDDVESAARRVMLIYCDWPARFNVPS